MPGVIVGVAVVILREVVVVDRVLQAAYTPNTRISGNEGIEAAVGNIVQSVAPGVVGLDLQPMVKPMLGGEAQAVVSGDSRGSVFTDRSKTLIRRSGRKTSKAVRACTRRTVTIDTVKEHGFVDSVVAHVVDGERGVVPDPLLDFKVPLLIGRRLDCRHVVERRRREGGIRCLNARQSATAAKSCQQGGIGVCGIGKYVARTGYGYLLRRN